jgi:hypothetical protein
MAMNNHSGGGGIFTTLIFTILMHYVAADAFDAGAMLQH